MVVPALAVPLSEYVEVPGFRVIVPWTGSVTASDGFCVNL